MGMQLLCDGCHVVVPENTPPRGIKLNAYYCDKCGDSVTAYEQDRDAVHTLLAASWQERLAELRGLWHETHRDGRLPDE